MRTTPALDSKSFSTHYCQVMASTPPIPPTTPLLLLGVVGILGPVNGYQIRRELLSWQVDKWANVNPGSIYHALGKLSDSGDLTRREVCLLYTSDAADE